MKHSGKLSAKLFLMCSIFLLVLNVHSLAQQGNKTSAIQNKRLFSIHQNNPADNGLQLVFNPLNSLAGNKNAIDSKRQFQQYAFSENGISFPRKFYRMAESGTPFSAQLILLGSLEMSKMHLKGESFTEEEIESLYTYDFGLLFTIIISNHIARQREENRMSDSNPVEPGNFNFQPVAHSSAQLSIRTGLKYIVRGVKESTNDFTSKTLINYLNLPIYGVYDFASMSEGHFFAGLGPYVGYALSGKYKDEENGVTTTTSITFGKNGGVKRGDFGIGLIAGYAIHKFIIQIGYDLGLTNLNYDDFDKVYNRSFKLEIGYLLTNLSKK